MYVTNRLQSTLGVQSAEPDDRCRQLKLTWDDGSTAKYPYVWLLDNCQSAKYYHPVSKARLLLMRDLDVDSKLKSVTVST